MERLAPDALSSWEKRRADVGGDAAVAKVLALEAAEFGWAVRKLVAFDAADHGCAVWKELAVDAAEDGGLGIDCRQLLAPFCAA